MVELLGIVAIAAIGCIFLKDAKFEDPTPRQEVRAFEME